MSIVGQVHEIWRYPLKSMGGERLDRCDVGPQGLLGDRGWALRDERAGEIRGAKKLPKLMLCQARYVEEPSSEKIPHVEISLPGGTTVRSDDSRAAERLSEFLGRSVTLWPVQPASDIEHYRRSRSLSDEALLRDYLSREPDEPLPDLSALPQSLLEELLEFASPLGTYFDVSPLHLLTTATVEALSSLNPDAVLDVRRFRPNFYIETPEDLDGFVEFAWCGKALRIGDVPVNCEIPAPRCGVTTHEQPGLPKDPSILRTIVRQAGQNIGIYASPAEPGSARIGDPVELRDPD